MALGLLHSIAGVVIAFPPGIPRRASSTLTRQARFKDSLETVVTGVTVLIFCATAREGTASKASSVQRTSLPLIIGILPPVMGWGVTR
jgi:hypothetical protein